MKNFATYFKGDRAIWLIALLLGVSSLLLVYSSIVTLAYKHHDGNTFYYLFRHGIFIGLGLVIMFVTHKMKYSYFSRISQLLLYLSIPLLLLTLIIGSNLNNASRWLVIPVINQSFQTSDLAKVALVMYVARMLYLKRNMLDNFRESFVPIIVPVGIVCALILPANFSTAAVLFVTCMIIMFMGGTPFKHFLSLIPAGIVAAAAIFLVVQFAPNLFPRAKTWQKRIERYSENKKDANGNYQIEQAKIAIAKGGVAGKGPGNSNQRNFLPHPYSDFIYAIVIEEYGLIGGAFILMLYLVLFFRTIKISQKTENQFAQLLAVGLCFLLVFQGFINMAVAVNLVPVTGQPLPLVSMGGTSTWFTCLSLGIILSVSRGVELENKKKIKIEDYAIA
ncbi:MAG: cell division protein FtsW [Crocinitomicaceae bacterium]|nr:cell division protein FtsW [Crocinitomicaceae bacterium]